MEQITRNDVGPEFVAYSELVFLVATGDGSPDLARRVAGLKYDLSPPETDELIAASRAAYMEMNALAPDARQICREDIQTAEEYASWSNEFARATKDRKLAMLTTVSSRIPESTWSKVMRYAKSEWTTRNSFGTRTNYERLVETEDFRVLLASMCD